MNSNVTDEQELVLPSLNVTQKDDVNEILEKVKLRSRSIIKAQNRLFLKPLSKNSKSRRLKGMISGQMDVEPVIASGK